MWKSVVLTQEYVIYDGDLKRSARILCEIRIVFWRGRAEERRI